jgi:4-hydroxy-3-methylbut-2-enyl diphosphate reductase
MNVLLANPRGFCAGVVRAIDVVEVALERFGAPVYVRHEVVHNRRVVSDLVSRGTVFVDHLAEVPDDAVAIFSAHGVPRAVVQEARERGLTVFDATCPLVTKVHVEVVRFARQGFDCIVIGHFGHPEVEGTLGQFDTRWGGRVHVVESVADVAGLTVQDPAKVGYVTQTTLSVDDTAAVIDALRLRFPEVHGPRRDDICYATQNRQDAVRELASRSDVVLVVGSANSSNSNRLREIAERLGVPAHLIDGADDIHAAWLDGAGTVGVTAGASAPEASVTEVLERLRVLGATQVDELPGDRESVHFPLPAKLRVLARG